MSTSNFDYLSESDMHEITGGKINLQKITKSLLFPRRPQDIVAKQLVDWGAYLYKLGYSNGYYSTR